MTVYLAQFSNEMSLIKIGYSKTLRLCKTEFFKYKHSINFKGTKPRL